MPLGEDGNHPICQSSPTANTLLNAFCCTECLLLLECFDEISARLGYRYAQALLVLQIFGGLYLLFLAFRAGRSALTSNEKLAARASADEVALSRGELYRRGLLMHLANPKSVLAWIALVTLGIGPNSSSQSIAAILGGCAVLSVTIGCSVT